ncbi:MAG: metallophosphoesterase [Caldisphaera sp.]|nr:hypothetical protein [Caldisphaera sp.]PMP59507.1 MAG: hypothetical protein C0202_02070 [Caldisphaera sp.]
MVSSNIKPYEIQTPRQMLILADIHYPNTRINLLEEALSTRNGTTVILLGDIIDEISYLNELLNLIRSYSNDVKIVIGDNELKFGIKGLKIYEPYKKI